MNLSARALTVLTCISAAHAAVSPRLSALRKKADKNENGWRRRRMDQMNDVPNLAQTFYVPLPEKTLLEETFQIIAYGAGPVVSIVGMSVSTDNTIIWYDHYEDGFESDLANPSQSTTLVWGDGNAANGCVPAVDPCTDANDVLLAGMSIILENPVDVDDTTTIKYGAGDKIVASLPIAVTRGGYPDYPGSSLGGAVEVMDTTWWGETYQTAISQTTPGQLDDNFEYVAAYIQAMEDATFVTYPDGTTALLNEGETAFTKVGVTGVEFGANKKVQVTLLTGDEVSTFELRWYAMIPVDRYYTEYLTPVGDRGEGGTQIVMYNPHSTPITVTCEYLYQGKKNQFRYQSYEVQPKSNNWSLNIPIGSGASFSSSDTFLALAVVDTGTEVNSGSVYDWGFPLLPANSLTPQALVGWGYGCNEKDCGSSGVSRSVIWVTVMEDASVWIDLDHDGYEDLWNRKFWRLMSKQYSDPDDSDMSGALIWATEIESGTQGPPVLFAAAWGQNPQLSGNVDSAALDMGTVVMPMQGVFASIAVELEEENPGDWGSTHWGVYSDGDTVRYTITVTNVGMLDYDLNTLLVQGTLGDNLAYVPGSVEYWSSNDDSIVSCEDSDGGYDLFPIISGIHNKKEVTKSGGSFQITFLAVIDAPVIVPIICNDGTVTGQYIDQEFSVCFRLPTVPREYYDSSGPTAFPFGSSTGEDAPTYDPSEEPTEGDDDLCGDDEETNYQL